ncbi:MAG TPA: hypothetical protein VN397_01970 [Candidatus Methylomirabilis sp.]|nr:hypothetical protein [Candidatus Methylomirabilis sp.]
MEKAVSNSPPFLYTFLDHVLYFSALAVFVVIVWSVLMDAVNRRKKYNESRLTKKHIQIARPTWSERFPRRK